MKKGAADVRTAIVIAAAASLVLGVALPGTAAAGAQDPIYAELGPDALPGPLHYVALGDSYSAGEGDPYLTADQQTEIVIHPELAGTPGLDVWLGNTGHDGCHRSLLAYPVRVFHELDRNDPEWGVSFRACSGATSQSLTDPSTNRGEPAQLSAFDDVTGGGRADLITMGMAGNDVSFSDIVRNCVTEAFGSIPGTSFGISDALGTSQACQDIWDDRITEKLPVLRATLAAEYLALRDGGLKDPAAGKVIVMGYPRVFPDDPPGTCSTGAAGAVDRDTMRWLNERVVDRVDATIATAAQDAGVTYLDVSAILGPAGSPDGRRHDACVDDGAQRWMNLIIPHDSVQSYHPKSAYHEVVAQMVLAQWCATPERGCPAR